MLQTARKTLSKTKALFVYAFTIETEYRAEIIIWMIAGSLPLIMMFVWMGLADAGPMGGYSPQDFAAYFLTVFLIRQVTAIWVIFELDREIRLGELSPKLLRPLDPYWMHVAHHLGAQVVRLPFLVPIIAVGVVLTGANFDFRPATVALFAVSLAAVWVIRFNLLYSVGLLTFWTDQAIALNSLIFTLYTVFSGMLIPIDFFPAGLREAILYTPFPYLIDFPVKIMLGDVTGAALVQGLAIQSVWVVVFVLLRLVMWRRGLRRYGAVGA